MISITAVLLAGHLADGAFWFDAASGNWVTSSVYRDDLPGYLRNLNEGRASAQYAGRRWDLLLSPDRYLHVRP
ncbi:MAG: alkaline phosphatase family protein, partial [Planctomycetes bacterium]|nr:alkaline phosphatase family protein [Planctomycetota bacterium]